MHQPYFKIKNNYTNRSYAIVVEYGRYNFSSVDVYDLSMEKLGSYEMVLDWTVGNTRCQEAQKDTRRYLCKERSECLILITPRAIVAVAPMVIEEIHTLKTVAKVSILTYLKISKYP